MDLEYGDGYYHKQKYDEKLYICGDDSDSEFMYITLCMSKYYRPHIFLDVISKIEQIENYYEDNNPDYRPDLNLTIKEYSDWPDECKNIIQSCIDYLLYKRKMDDKKNCPMISRYISDYLKIDDDDLEISEFIQMIIHYYDIGEYGGSMRTMWLNHNLYKDRELDQQKIDSLDKWVENNQNRR